MSDYADDEREALTDSIRASYAGSWDAEGTDSYNRAAAEFDAWLAGFRRQGPITDTFREIRARIAAEDVPIHVSADIEQIICETGGDFGDESTRDVQ